MTPPPNEQHDALVGTFTHHAIVKALIWELGFLNDRVICGDYLSAKHALPHAKRHCDSYASMCKEDGLYDVSFQPYVAAAGLVGVQMSYVFPCGTKVCHSMTPKNR